MDRRQFVTAGALVPVATLSGGATAASRAVDYVVRHDRPRQVMRGLGFEIQCDSIGSDNLGLPEKVVAVPHDLVPAERARLYREMVRGFRYCRLAMGLYLRGLNKDKTQIVERYPNQMADLRELQTEGGFEGYSTEYWSPTPAWKENGRYEGGRLKSYEPAFLDKFGDALARDVAYLKEHGLKVVEWGLQNEPFADGDRYSACGYMGDAYYKTFKAVAPKIRAGNPDIFIQAGSGLVGQHDHGCGLIGIDPATRALVDGWSWHRIGADSNEQIEWAPFFKAKAYGKPVLSNEFEYLDNATSDARFVNTAQSIMNWFSFCDARSWYWLHALKPVANAEASGYALGFWRPPGDTDRSRYPDLKEGHWTFNPQNFNAVAGFIRHMPWDSVRLHVEEAEQRKDNRILAWRSPAGKLGLALSNRSGKPFRFAVRTGATNGLSGTRFTPSRVGMPLGRSVGATLAVELPDNAVEFWTES